VAHAAGACRDAALHAAIRAEVEAAFGPAPLPEAVEEQELGQTALLAALLGGCRAMRIPLPRRGHKALELMGDRLALTVMLNTEPAVVEARHGAIRYADTEADRVRERVN
jgi:hypothetical protein